jgi:hypothetical protein
VFINIKWGSFMKNLLTLVLKKLGDNGLLILKKTATAILQFFRTFIKPFFFSHNKSYLIAPYFYVFIGMILLFGSVGLFLYLTYIAAIIGIQDAAVVLTTLSGTIGILMALTTLMTTVYNKGKNTQTESPEEKSTVENE